MKKIYWSTVLIATILVGCTKASLEETVPTTFGDYGAVAQASEHFLYPLETMQAIAEQIDGTSGYVHQLAPTKRYIAFYPKNPREFQSLLNRSDIDWSRQSIFEELVLPEGRNYISPEDTDKTSALYAFIETGTPLPEGIACEVLQEYYNPFHDRTGSMDNATAAKMLERAAAMEPETRADLFSPTGTITLSDNITGTNIPLAGLTFQLRYSDDNGTIVQENVTTDPNGRYTATLYYPGTIRFTINWKYGNYTINDEDLTQAFTTGHIYDGRGSLNFHKIMDFRSHVFATAYRGIYAASQYGLSNIGYNGTFPVVCISRSVPPGRPDVEFISTGDETTGDYIRLYCNNKECIQILGPLTGALGFADILYNYDNTNIMSNTVVNSYALFVRSYLLDREYARTGHLSRIHTQEVKDGKTYIRPDQYNLQDWVVPTTGDRTQTSLFIDLYDDFDQAEYYGDDLGGSRPTDYICINDFATVRSIAIHSSTIAEAMNLTRTKATQFGFRTGDVSLLHYTYQQLE